MVQMDLVYFIFWIISSKSFWCINTGAKNKKNKKTTKKKHVKIDVVTIESSALFCFFFVFFELELIFLTWTVSYCQINDIFADGGI